MSTTGMSAYRGKHVIKAASNTQTVIVVSSRESDVYAMVRGTATALGIKSMAREYGGRRNGSTRGDTVVVGAGSFAQARCADSENPSHQLEDSSQERSRDKPYRKELPILGECVFYLPLDRTRGRANKAVSEVPQWSASRTEAGNQRDRCTSAQRQVLSASQRSSEKQSQNWVCGTG